MRRRVGQGGEVAVEDLVGHLRPEVARRAARARSRRRGRPRPRGSAPPHAGRRTWRRRGPPVPGPLCRTTSSRTRSRSVLGQAPVLAVRPQRQVAEDPALRVAGDVEAQGAVVDILVRGEGRADRREDTRRASPRRRWSSAATPWSISVASRVGVGRGTLDRQAPRRRPSSRAIADGSRLARPLAEVTEAGRGCGRYGPETLIAPAGRPSARTIAAPTHAPNGSFSRSSVA